jgi:hypothetical protein
VPAASVTGELFETLGVPALLGRTLGPADSTPGAADVVVLGYGIWQRRFGASPAIVGERIQVNGRAREVVGIMPPDFHLPLDYSGTRPTQLWTAVIIDPADLGEWAIDRS